MEENKKNWLEDQTITIPVEEYIKIRIEMATQNQKEDKLWQRAWDAEEKLKETQKALEDAKEVIKQYKADIERLLGINELEKVEAEQEENA